MDQPRALSELHCSGRQKVQNWILANSIPILDTIDFFIVQIVTQNTTIQDRAE